MLDRDYRLCPHCNQIIKVGATKCRHCKASVSEAHETTVKVYPPVYKYTQNNRKPRILFFLGIGLLLISLVLIVSNLIGRFNNPIPSENVGGNSAGNLNNMGLVAKQDGWVYYYNVGITNKIHKARLAPDGNVLEGTVISEVPGMYLNVVGDYLYFVYPGNVPQDVAGIYRVNIDGTNLTRIHDYPNMPSIVVVDDWIYFTAIYPPGSPKRNIYKMRTDGTKLTELYAGGDASSINVVDGWIYFNTYDLQNIYKEGTGNIYKIRIDGKGLKQLTDDRSVGLVVEDGWIYYSNYNDDMSIYKVGIDGSNKTKLSTFYASDLNINDGWIYFAGKDNHIYRVDLNGGNYTAFNSFKSRSVNIVGEWLFFVPLEGSPAGKLSFTKTYNMELQ